MRGRKPVPAALKVLRGNPGKRPINTEEAKPSRALPECPDHLQGEARAEWDRMATELHSVGLLTTIDRAALAGYCQSWGRWVEAENEVRRLGSVVKAKNGFPVLNPYLTIATSAMKQMRAFLVEFGMTPSSRSRASTAPGDSDNENPFARLGGGKA